MVPGSNPGGEIFKFLNSFLFKNLIKKGKGYKRIFFVFVFLGKEGSDVLLIPTESNLDPIGRKLRHRHFRHKTPVVCGVTLFAPSWRWAAVSLGVFAKQLHFVWPMRSSSEAPFVVRIENPRPLE